MENRIALTLITLFERHRIVFWYDSKHELRNDFEALELPDIEKLEIINNEYGIKYRILREQPEQKFLLYQDGTQPADLDNWLLDVLLANGEFRTDQVAMWLADLELGPEFTDLVQAHTEFFQAVKRKDALKKLLQAEDTVSQMRLKMLAICVGGEPRIDAILESLLQELADNRDEKIKLSVRCGLDSFLWEQMSRIYNYTSETPSIKDFVIVLFKSCYAMSTDGREKLAGDALVFLKRWKDSRQFEKSFEVLSNECADVLGIEQDLAKRDFRDLVELDYFRLIDQKIISDLVKTVALRTISGSDVSMWIRQRRQSHWYPDFQELYEAVDYAVQFIHTLGETKLSMGSFTEGVQNYSRFWYQLDLFYRKFTYYVRKSGQASLMGDLTEQIENLYSNNYLLKLGDCFQNFVDATAKWQASPIHSQTEFFSHWVKPFLHKEKKIYVIISDAMRYEIADELLTIIRREDRYNAELEPALGVLPSYTQLGMAALLPHKELAIADNDSGIVLVDGQSSQGTANRVKILDNAMPKRATACKADELMAMKKEECRAFVRDHDVIYVYHNRIDAVGDKRESEESVFEAVEDALQDLMNLIKKLTAANASNLLVTADHGFIYQNRIIDESDFVGENVAGGQVLFKDRRFVLGKGLNEVTSMHKFKSQQLGLASEIEIQIPKSINRLRLKGSGSRYVHGGASLQEVVIPVLKINKKRQNDVSVVDVEILRGTSYIITSGQLAVTLYQSMPVTEKIQARTLRAGIYTESGELISDSHDLTFDISSENPREREQQVRFVLTKKADDANGQDVILRLEEKLTGTTHYKEYKSLKYVMRRSFTSDFDF